MKGPPWFFPAIGSLCLLIIPPLMAKQQNKTDSDTKKLPLDTNVAAQGTVEISEGKDGKFRFFVRDSQGKLVGGSGLTGFESKEAATKAVQSLKEILNHAKLVYPEKKKGNK
ncbi:MAG: hypothetical protein ACKO9Z_12295 [Planctomycetota bacterium]|jgi:uncharacterized protein YegP (UPF0339 family)|nr:hypothetical protein [Planctomycetota bacterium]